MLKVTRSTATLIRSAKFHSTSFSNLPAVPPTESEADVRADKYVRKTAAELAADTVAALEKIKLNEKQEAEKVKETKAQVEGFKAARGV